MKSQYPNLLNGHFGPVAFDSADEHRTYIIGLISGNPETKDEEVYAVTDWIAKNQSDALRPHNNNAATPKAAIYAIAESPLPHMSADERRRIYAFVLANTAGLSMLFPGDDRNEVFNAHDGKRQPGIIILSNDVDTRESAPGSQQSRHMLSVMLSVAEGMQRAAAGNQNSGAKGIAEMMKARVDQAMATAEEAAQALTRERDDNIQLRQQLADAHSEIETLRRLSGRSFVTDSEPVEPGTSTPAPELPSPAVLSEDTKRAVLENLFEEPSHTPVPPDDLPRESPSPEALAGDSTGDTPPAAVPPAPKTEPAGAPTAAQLKARLKK